MPYSMDATENQNNPRTPSEISLGEQLLYRVASLDSTVQQGFRRVDESIERMRSDFHDAQLATNDRINNLDKEMHETFAFKRARIDSLVEKGEATRKDVYDRITALETWKAVAMGKIAVLIGSVVVIWTFVAPTIRAFIGISSD